MERYEKEVVIECPPERVFEFWTQPANLPPLSEESLPMQVASAPEQIEQDSDIRLTITKLGMTQQLHLKVVSFDPPREYVEEQVSGPFGQWRHTHRFEPAGDGATRMIDVVEVAPPGGMLAMFLTAERLAQEIEAFFEERHERSRDILEQQVSPRAKTREES